MASEIATQCAERLYEAMENIDDKVFPWWHNPHTFLPANFEMNQVQRNEFRILLAETVQKVLDQNKGKRL